MKIAVGLSINVKEIEKARLYEGKKGTYLSAVAFVDMGDVDQYGNNGMITQSVSKEEKASGVQGNILGNGKIIWKDDEVKAILSAMDQASNNQPQQAPQQQAPMQDDFDDSDIPF